MAWARTSSLRRSHGLATITRRLPARSHNQTVCSKASAARTSGPGFSSISLCVQSFLLSNKASERGAAKLNPTCTKQGKKTVPIALIQKTSYSYSLASLSLCSADHAWTYWSTRSGWSNNCFNCLGIVFEKGCNHTRKECGSITDVAQNCFQTTLMVTGWLIRRRPRSKFTIGLNKQKLEGYTVRRKEKQETIISRTRVDMIPSLVLP